MHRVSPCCLIIYWVAMRVIFVITGLGTGGAEIMLFKLLKGIDRECFEPTVISLTTKGEIGPRIAGLNIPVISLGVNGVLSAIFSFFRLTHLIRQIKPQIVHSWLYHADILGGLSARLAGVPVVIWGVRTSDLDANTTKWTTRVIRRLCGLLSHVIPTRILFNSEKSGQIHVTFGYNKNIMEIIPNGFDLSRFAPDVGMRTAVRAELNIPIEAIVVGMVGRFDPQKNYAGFAKVMKLLCERLDNIYFVLVGKNVTLENGQIFGWIAESGALKNCRLLGLRSDIARLMTAMDVLALPSSYGEAFPNVLGEAMSCGVPCVTTDVGDSAYIVGDAGGIVSPDDMAGFAEAIVSLVTAPMDERKRISESARARVFQLFDIRSVITSYEKCYLELQRVGTAKKIANPKS